MAKDKKNTKSKLHPRNRNNKEYDLESLVSAHPPLQKFLLKTKHGKQSIIFSDPEAVKALNTAILTHQYSIKDWSIPLGYLCPPVPGRADYIHTIADIMASFNDAHIPKGNRIQVFDLGVGANCIYPLIGYTEYRWSFIGSDLDSKALKNAQKILDKNPDLKPYIQLIHQKNEEYFFKNIIKDNEYFDVMVCNPPFFKSIDEANAATTRKVTNLNKVGKQKDTSKNFGGLNHELCYEGGERAFISNMIKESKTYATQFFLFSTLVSRRDNLKSIEQELDKHNPSYKSITPMSQGNKVSRILSWSYLTEKQRRIWMKTRWH